MTTVSKFQPIAEILSSTHLGEESMARSEDRAPANASDKLADLTRKLEENEIALKVLLDRRERDIERLRDEFHEKLRSLVLPYVENLRRTTLSPEQSEFLEILEKNLQSIYDPAYAKLSSPAFRLSPTEVKVAQLIRDGKTNKEIAKLMHLSRSTILTHRHHIRVKLGIKNKKVNLRSFLLG